MRNKRAYLQAKADLLELRYDLARARFARDEAVDAITMLLLTAGGSGEIPASLLASYNRLDFLVEVTEDVRGHQQFRVILATDVVS